MFNFLTKTHFPVFGCSPLSNLIQIENSPTYNLLASNKLATIKSIGPNVLENSTVALINNYHIYNLSKWLENDSDVVRVFTFDLKKVIRIMLVTFSYVTNVSYWM
jgi:hypothetical protein